MKTSRTRRYAGWVALFAAAALGLAGCSGSLSSTASASGGKAAIQSAPKEITVSFPAAMSNLNPLRGYNAQESSALHLIGANLFEFQHGKLNPQPGLAESATTSADQLTWTFKLRPSLSFSDGSPLTSADVKAMLDQQKTDPANIWAAFVEPITSVSAPDANTVVVRLARPYPALRSILAENGFAVFPKSAWQAPDSYWTHPAVSGMYQLQPWDGGANATLVRNPHYWGGKASIPTVKFTTIPDANTAAAQLQTGQIDLAEGLPMSVQPALDVAKGVEYKLIQQYGFFGISLNNLSAPLDDKRVRKAISLAVDRAEINKVAFRGLAQPLSSFWPKTMDGYDPSISTKQDIAAAKKLLVGTPCESGCTIDLAFSDALSWSSQTAQLVATQLQKVGINAKLSHLSATQWANQVEDKQTFQMAINESWDYVNVPDGQLLYAFDTNPFSQAFKSSWSDPKLAEISTAAKTTTGAGRAAALKAVNDVFLADQPYVTLTAANDLFAQRVSTDFVAPNSSDYIDIAHEK